CAARLAREAVSMPMEGTVLTVLDSAARGCAAEDETAEVARAASDSAFTALARTTRQLDVLEAAGVVDAGGVGLLLILDALAETLTGEAVERPVFERSARARLGRSGAAIARMELDGGPGDRGARGDDADDA